jgi:hypothetical protein
MSEKPSDRELGRALWCVVMAAGGTARVPRSLEQDFNSQHVLAKLETFLDPITGDLIIKATAEPKSRKGILRADMAKLLTVVKP